MTIAYGIKIQGFDDPYIVNIEESMNGLNIAAIPGSFLVDQIPALKYVPSWFPGAGFKKKAAYWAEVNRKVAELPFNHVAQQMVRSIPNVCFNITLDLLIYVLESGHSRPKSCSHPNCLPSRRR
jgi:hypothetical protein